MARATDQVKVNRLKGILILFNLRFTMKKIFFLATALLAAAACTREPVVPEDPVLSEEPIIEQTAPIQVTLVAGNPETRTELGFVGNSLKPFWSKDDLISVVWIPESQDDNFEEDPNGGSYWYHPFNGPTQKASKATFTGSVNQGGQYRAFYPAFEWVQEVYDDEIYAYSVGPNLDQFEDYDDVTENWVYFPCLRFTIPSVQTPTATSFDPKADLLVSNPFTVENKGDASLGNGNTDIPIHFSRVNAIVRIKFHVEETDPLFETLTDEQIRKVALGAYSGGDIKKAKVSPGTRAQIVDNDDDPHGLTGDVVYMLPFVDDLEQYDANVDDSFIVSGAYSDYAVAQYSDDTAYPILSNDTETATYLIVVPSILKNEEYDGMLYGLPIMVETDNYVIRREITLPPSGIALQPSRVTTLNITLSENNTEVVNKGISLSKSETTLIPGDGEYLDLEANEIAFPRDIYNATEFQQYFTVDAPAGVSLRYVEYGEVGDYGTYVGNETVEYLYLSVDSSVQPGNYEVTISYAGCSATIMVHVIYLNDSPFITFTDAKVKAICAAAWGGRREAGKITLYEASRVTTLSNPDNDYKSYFHGNTEIISFNELQYFTGLTTLGQDAFYGCTSLESVKLPESLTMIEHGYYGAGAFMYCSGLESVDFSDCTDLEGIGDYAFYGCTSLTSITLPASVRFISDYAFYSCQSLTTFTIPENSQLYAIYAHAFDYCLLLNSISLPSSLKTIGEDAFSDCRALTSISIPEGVEAISPRAFYQCESLESVSIPSTITSIGENAFFDCRNLETVNVLGQGQFSIGRGAFAYSGLTNIDLLLQCATSVGNSAFEFSAVKSVEIPSTMTTIPTSFLNGCEDLESVTFASPSQVTRINDAAFLSSGLRSIVLPNSVTSLGSDVFNSCTNLASVTIPEGITDISGGLFRECTSLSSVSILGSVKTIGEMAFSKCSSLEQLTIPGKLTSIEKEAFSFSGLKSIEFDFNDTASSVSLGKSAFYMCTQLESIWLPNCLETVDDYTFYGCTSLSSVHLPNQLTRINNGAFSDCLSLRSIEFPGNLTRLNNAFSSVTFRSGNGETGVKFNGLTPPTFVGSAVINGEHWDGTDWVAGVEIQVPSGSESAYSAVANILNTNNIIVGF